MYINYIKLIRNLRTQKVYETNIPVCIVKKQRRYNY